MTLYTYRCTACTAETPSQERADRLHERCSTCGHTAPLKRVWGFSAPPIMHEHFNHSVGQPISSMSKYKEALKVKSAQDAERLGMDVNYQPIDMNDREALGVTGEGIDESNRAREKQGAPLLPEIK